MTVDNLRRLETQFLNDQKITAEEAQQLVSSTWDWGGFSREERAELKAILIRDARKLEPGARQTIERFLGNQDNTAPVIASITGANPSTFADDSVFLGRDGTQRGESGVTGHSRGYDSTQAGPLRFAHGSSAPVSRVLSAAENQRIKGTPPGAALDAAASAWGVRVDGFQKLAHSKDFFDPTAESWWGKCHAWAWAALDQRVNKLVDVEGPDGKKGVWIGGQWLSRADLGNWMMATADGISLADPQTMFKGELTASELVKGTTQFMMNNGGGVVADIHNDKKKGHKEVWNQPFVSSELTTRALQGDGALAVLKQSRKDGFVNGLAVKQVTIVGTYGAERGDDHEGAPGTGTKKWNLYAVTDANGKMITAYMADDAKLRGAALPTRTTDDLPEYFWKPKLQALDDVLAGKRNWTVENDKHGAEFKFFVGTVLTKGVSGTVRSAFEADLQAAPAGPVEPGRVRELARKYPGVANAYSPEQWRGLFQSRGLEPRAFGASWPVR